MPDVFEVLGKDHAEVKELLTELGKRHPGGRRANRAELSERKDMVSELIAEEFRHEAIEEMYFWPVVRDKLPDGDELADAAVVQENEVKKVLAKLGPLEAGSPEFEKLLSEFASSGPEHISFEERQVWPKLRRVLSREEARQIGRQLQEGRKTALAEPGLRHIPAQRSGEHDMAGKTKAELYEDARRLGVHGRSTMSKEELAREVAQHW